MSGHGFFHDYDQDTKRMLFYGCCIPCRIGIAAGLYFVAKPLGSLYWILILLGSLLIIGQSLKRQQEAPDVWWSRERVISFAFMAAFASALLPASVLPFFVSGFFALHTVLGAYSFEEHSNTLLAHDSSVPLPADRVRDNPPDPVRT